MRYVADNDTNCDLCEIPYGVFTMMHKFRLAFRRHYLSEVARAKKLRIVERLKTERMAKRVLVESCAAPKQEHGPSKRTARSRTWSKEQFTPAKIERMTRRW